MRDASAVVLRLSGKAGTVFRLIALLARHRGHATLKELAAAQKGEQL